MKQIYTNPRMNERMNIKKISIFAFSLAMSLSISFGAEDPATDKQIAREGAPAETEESRDARMQWWRDGKFGMFIHYGLYSGLAGELQGKKYNGCVEWIQQMSGMDSATYANEALPKFSYKSGNAEEWVKLAKKAGCAYTVLTSRHHEGFNMFETKFIDFNAKKAIDIDVIKEFSSACKKHEMKAGYYFSVIDWSHPDYDPTGAGTGLPYPAGNHTAQKAGKRHFGNHDKYKEYLYNIFNELITNYDPIDIIWWDFSNVKFDGDRAWNATRLMKHLFETHPKAIQNNRLYGHVHGETRPTPTWQGDFSTPEQFVPATGIGGDWETCQTTNGSWGYSATNHDWKSSVTLIHELIDTVSRGGNYLLNIGPEPDGSVPAAAIKLFTEMGAWMEKNGDAIYGTRANPLEVELPWGRLTRKGDDTTYIFVYANPGTSELILPCNFADGAQATLLDSGKQIKMTQDKELKTTSFSIEGVTLHPAATVIKVTGKRLVISAKGFDELKMALTSATQILDKVKNPEHLVVAMQAIQTIHEQHEKSADLQAIIKLTPDTCPANLKPAYEQAMKAQNELKDAAKRLMMGGVMRSDATSIPYGSFIDKFSLPDLAKDEPTNHEGAPKETPEERDARMAWWRDGKFGMFIHYGLYSGLAGELQGKKYSGCVEWIFQRSDLDSDTYAREALPKFNPKTGKTEEWVKLAKEAGCTYTVLTSRHHEGFNLFESKFSDFNAKKTKGIDIIKEYSAACKKHDMKTGYYFSMIDWSHPDYDPTGSGVSYPAGNYVAQKEGRRQFGNHAKYKEHLYNIFNELLTNYAPVDLVWWDFSQPNFQGDKAWDATKLMRNLFLQNPNAIQNNRLYHSDNHLNEGGIKVTPTWKGDYSTAEHHVPATGIGGDWETCQTLNGTWGYSAENQKWKTSAELIQQLIDTVSRGGNFLLNIGPEPDGSIPSESIRLFKEIGAWMQKNGDAIYGTRANPLNFELSWGRLTQKGDDTTYIFVYFRPGTDELIIPCNFADDAQATLLDGGKQIKMVQDKARKTTSIFIDGVTLHPAATVIKVKGKWILPVTK